MTSLLTFIIGSCFGSFLSVIEARIKDDKKGIILGRSECPYCKNTLQAVDLVPILSYVYSRGKCRMCLNTISKKYPLLELITGLIFMTLTIKLDFIEIVKISPILLLFLANTYQDYFHKQVESILLYLLVFTSLIYSVFFTQNPLDQIFLWGLVGFSFFYIQELLKPGAIGDADSYIGLSIGFFFANQKTLTSIFLGYWIATLIIVPIFLYKYKSIKNKPIALIPFLFAGFYINLLI